MSRRHTTSPTPLRKRLVSDVLPGFESKLHTPTSTTGKGSFALQDGLAFIGYAAQAIAQDEFSKCFTQRPRRRFSPKTILLGPLYWMGWVVRYCLLFPYRLVLLLAATIVFFVGLPIVLHFENEHWQVSWTEQMASDSNGERKRAIARETVQVLALANKRERKRAIAREGGLSTCERKRTQAMATNELAEPAQ
ncbi:uncharacterized protein SPPG_08052 [Spizellomyces punctatus DAOM BR117]|uniref:Uncharacterized protein n=1 Tax=Spizellomyces punctatus (strain DAOM BR117) TaxID=645134 RepID=A0A0L0H660_SPIPD|nr:uncharacterized protein SPPG_08052 [Spizellomyces punctatus DAOM BR117]KNC96459.1 hypothetical protein SPPG_08052 [Spizellomyces punctatus DAOM BR117]|eukprot:XP_016604499.1 hypothetical protein SPPG_08052 [Spizellomyces punctatus DAOM BR117]